MSEQALQFIQQQQTRKMALPKHMRLAGATNLNGEPVYMPGSPDDPEWRKRIPRADPMPEELVERPESPVLRPVPVPTVSLAAPAVGVRDKRVIVSYAPERHFVIGIEAAPDWDLDGDIVTLDRPQVMAVLWVARSLGVRVKDLTGVFNVGEIVAKGGIDPSPGHNGGGERDVEVPAARKKARAETAGG